jgi:predicted methyltransferase
VNFPDDYVNQVILGDCLEVMRGIPDNSIEALIHWAENERWKEGA